MCGETKCLAGGAYIEHLPAVFFFGTVRTVTFKAATAFLKVTAISIGACFINFCIEIWGIIGNDFIKNRRIIQLLYNV